jgi:hypothetical protein
MMVIVHILVFWVVTSYSLVGLKPEDGDSMFHRNVRLHLKECVVSQPRTLTLTLDGNEWSASLTHFISMEGASTAD